jgi:hypothetical protein
MISRITAVLSNHRLSDSFLLLQQSSDWVRSLVQGNHIAAHAFRRPKEANYTQLQHIKNTVNFI